MHSKKACLRLLLHVGILQKLYDLGLGTRTEPVIVTKGINELGLDYAAIGNWFSNLGSFFTRMFRVPARAA